MSLFWRATDCFSASAFASADSPKRNLVHPGHHEAVLELDGVGQVPRLGELHGAEHRGGEILPPRPGGLEAPGRLLGLERHARERAEVLAVDDGLAEHLGLVERGELDGAELPLLHGLPVELLDLERVRLHALQRVPLHALAEGLLLPGLDREPHFVEVLDAGLVRLGEEEPDVEEPLQHRLELHLRGLRAALVLLVRGRHGLREHREGHLLVARRRDDGVGEALVEERQVHRGDHVGGAAGARRGGRRERHGLRGTGARHGEREPGGEREDGEKAIRHGGLPAAPSRGAVFGASRWPRRVQPVCPTPVAGPVSTV
ncbi:MAG: hypothetical protein QM704_20640 [Anaeromyxobacteraceae bacterium]